jgi:hypothetical protein
MLSEKENENIESFGNEQLNNSFREINAENQNNLNNYAQRGFNIFLAHGISPMELRTLRYIYHLSYLHNNRYNARNIDWSPQAIFRREETWLNSRVNNYYRMLNQNTYNRRGIIIRNPMNNTFYLFVQGNRFRPRNFYRQTNYEPNINFLVGFIFGIFLNIFSICILMIRHPRAKFRVGLILGMILSMIFTLPLIIQLNNM